MALVGAQGEGAARDALRQMRGGVSKIALEARAGVVRLLAGVEAALDFPEEIGEREATAGLREGGLALAASLRAACDPRAEKLLREGLDVVIAGRPNVGKSTLLNALLGEQRAIVTDLPGTTRDTLTERLVIGGLVVQLTDTAGLRESGDAIGAAEAIGVARAREALERADVGLIVLDASAPLTSEDEALLAEPCGQARIVVLNKCDLQQCTMYNVQCTNGGGGAARVVRVSALTGQGVPELLDALRGLAALPGGGDAAFTRARHIAAATQAAEALEEAVAALDAGLPADMAAIDLRRALDALGAITGETLSEDVIDAIFANFCVGK